MKCPNCDFEIESGYTCPQCGMDAVLFATTYNVSDSLYNRGLDSLSVQDLTGAMDCLKKSIEFNKNNFLARNLLGLIYYEIGHLGDACIQWVISASMLRDGNPAVRYMEEVQKAGRESLEKLNDSVIMYNQALEYIKQKSDDMAIIQLKKAVEINPKFIDAMNLLTFCYLIQKNKGRAQSLVERVLSMDVNNKIALNYYKEIFPSRSRPDSRSSKNMQDSAQSQKSPFSKLIPEDKRLFMNTFHLPEVVSFVVGLAIAFALMFILVMPGITQSKEQELEALKTTTAAAEQKHKSEIERYEKEIKDLVDEKKLLEGENSRASEQARIQETMQKITTAESQMQQSNLEAAANVIYTISSDDIATLNADMKARVNTIIEEAYPVAAASAYDQAVEKYTAGEYENSKSLLEKASVFGKSGEINFDGILYHLGLNAQALGNIDEARQYYQRVIDDYPNSAHRIRAQSHLDDGL